MKNSISTFPKCIKINSLIPTKINNLILASSVFNYKAFFFSKKKPINRDEKDNKRELNKGRLMSLEIIEEENNKINLKILAQKEQGLFFLLIVKNYF